MIFSIKQRPIRLAGTAKRDVRSQFGALPWRICDGKVEILLVSARSSGRWVLPKGWPMHKQTPAEAAATEAFEEAGVEGKVSDMPVGFYSYRKAHDGDDMPIIVAMFPLRVKKMLKNWPEKRQRKRKWVSRKKAASILKDPELREIVKHFNPRPLKR